MKSVIFLTTRTSATGSMWRTIGALARGKFTAIRVDTVGRSNAVSTDRSSAARIISEFVPPKEDHVILWNSVDNFNFNLDLSDYNFIINARDPRDLIVNKYWWEFAHPYAGKTEEKNSAKLDKLSAKIDALVANGIDQYALSRTRLPEFEALERIVHQLAPESWSFIGYALYCLHFDDAVAKIASRLGVELPGLSERLRDLIEAERTENLADNKRWIGQVFEGSDIAPGRHRRELQPETIAQLNLQHAGSLAFLRQLEDPRLQELYD